MVTRIAARAPLVRLHLEDGLKRGEPVYEEVRTTTVRVAVWCPASADDLGSQAPEDPPDARLRRHSSEWQPSRAPARGRAPTADYDSAEKKISTTDLGGRGVRRLTVTTSARDTNGPTSAGQMPAIQLSSVPCVR